MGVPSLTSQALANLWTQRMDVPECAQMCPACGLGFSPIAMGLKQMATLTLNNVGLEGSQLHNMHFRLPL